MKTLYIIPILAMMFAVGCTSGSTGKTINVVEQVEPAEIEVDTPTEIDVTIVKPETPDAPAPLKPARIDAASFLNALIESGCIIDKAVYKEVSRGGGIVVTCKEDGNPLNTEGLEDL